jgi:hypothetical protein
MIARELVQARDPHELHATLDFGLEIAQGFFHATLPAGRQSVEVQVAP